MTDDELLGYTDEDEANAYGIAEEGTAEARGLLSEARRAYMIERLVQELLFTENGRATLRALRKPQVAESGDVVVDGVTLPAEKKPQDG